MSKLIIVSNRLPISITRKDGTFEYKRNSGGLVTGLLCLQNQMEFLWIGNIPSDFNEEEKKEIQQTLKEKYESHAVFIPKTLNDLSYNGYCNQILWPILHNFENSIQNEKNYEAYKEFNLLFANEICELIEEDDIVWVHDYHLMLLPYLLRKLSTKSIKIGFFLHTVFPISEFFNQLNQKDELLTGLLCADSIAFHSLDYVANFTDTIRSLKHQSNIMSTYLCRDLVSLKNNEKSKEKINVKKFSKSTSLIKNLDIKISNTQITFEERKIDLSAIPIGIDPTIFHEELQSEYTLKRVDELRNTIYKGKHIFLGVDRIDFIKGIPQRIQAFERLLIDHPELIDKVVFLQVGVPSRENIDEYKKLTDLIKLKIQNINSKFGKINESLVDFIHGSVAFPELVALYCAAHTCVITSLQDGMNLVALEYVASQSININNKNNRTLVNNNGVLVLSEKAGATTLLTGSIFCNPNSILDIKRAMLESMQLSEDEKMKRLKFNNEAVNTFTSENWAKENLYFLK